VVYPESSSKYSLFFVFALCYVGSREDRDIPRWQADSFRCRHLAAFRISQARWFLGKATHRVARLPVHLHPDFRIGPVSISSKGAEKTSGALWNLRKSAKI